MLRFKNEIEVVFSHSNNSLVFKIFASARKDISKSYKECMKV